MNPTLENCLGVSVVVSACANDMNVFVQGRGDIQELEGCLDLYEKAKVTWSDDQWTEGYDSMFPSLSASPAVEEWSEQSGLLLSMKTPALGTFS